MLYLVKLAVTHFNFRYPELDSVLEFLGVDPKQAYDRRCAEENSSYVIMELPSEAAAREMQRRAILVDKVLELWGHGADYDAVSASLALLSQGFKAPYMAPEVTWSLVVEGAGKTLSLEQQDASRYRILAQVPFPGRIRLKGPDHRYWLIEDYAEPEDARPRHVYFGRELPGAPRGRELVGAGDLKKRQYLGPTSLDNEVALLMAGFAHIRPGSLVLDPFVGTGSILIACARFGAFCVGTDIDIRVLRGKKGRNVFSNFRQYGLPLPELVRSDNALYEGHFRSQPLYDAIVCDPPYGIRAGARRTGSRREEVKPVPDHLRHDHIPQTRPYAVNDVMTDLLGVSARALKLGGRLVYLLPVDLSPEAPPPEPIPEHPCMEQVCVVDQPLNSKLIRKMIVMRKVAEPAAQPQQQQQEEELKATAKAPQEEEREQKRLCA